MDDALQSVLAREIAGQARTIEDVNGLMRLMMKSALELMLDTEMDVHLGRRSLTRPADESTTTDEPSAVEIVPFFDEQGIPLLRVLTDRGTEYCGNREHHEYQLLLGDRGHRPHEDEGKKPADQWYL